ncbi:MAG: TetR/AcrR family transcriptional regulator [Rhodococcus sp. (in: high G+C Gram-positive bacteria)]|jgi:AcrR family transcriptional regulator|nr:MAG: TetR/AcrR family transcriptional regulator [Rhodococcus sp. (in: high G+C Gram-positive bacteria)]
MTSSSRTVGRPRVPDLGDRVLDAARTVYGDRGWSGFTVDEVARRAGVGKGSLYLRWPNKAALLVDAVRSAAPSVGNINLGNLELDLHEFARQWMAFAQSIEGTMVSRLILDRQSNEELAAVIGELDYPDYVRSTRALVRRAVQRGEIDPDIKPTLVADLIAGAITTHVRSTPPGLAEIAHTESYLTQLVATVLRGVGYRSLPTQDSPGDLDS